MLIWKRHPKVLTRAQIEKVLQTIQYKDWRFSLDTFGNTLIIEGPIVEVYSGSTTTLQNLFYFNPTMIYSEEQLIDIVWTNIQQAEMHESQEHFIVGDKRPYEPHNNKDVIPPFTGKNYSYPRYTDMKHSVNRNRWFNQRVGNKILPEIPTDIFWNNQISKSISHS